MRTTALLLILSIPLFAAGNYWAGYGIMTHPEKDYLRKNNNSKLITWGLGYGFRSYNLVFFEAGYGLNAGDSYDGSSDRTSFVKVGFERYLNLIILDAYLGLAMGSLVRTIEADRRGTNWQIGGTEYAVTGIRKRSSLTEFAEANVGIRFFRNFLPGMSFDWNIFSFMYDGNNYRYMSAVNLVYVAGVR